MRFSLRSFHDGQCTAIERLRLFALALRHGRGGSFGDRGTADVCRRYRLRSSQVDTLLSSPASVVPPRGLGAPRNNICRTRPDESSGWVQHEDTVAPPRRSYPGVNPNRQDHINRVWRGDMHAPDRSTVQADAYTYMARENRRQPEKPDGVLRMPRAQRGLGEGHSTTMDSLSIAANVLGYR